VPADYEQLAGRYDEDRAGWTFARDGIVDELSASGRSVRVLDLGCGTGRWLAAQRDLFGASSVTWVGADPSSAMLAQAHRKALTNLVRARAEKLPFRDAAVDYVASSYAFHHFSDKDRALDEIGRVLVSGGVFRINNIEPTAAHGWWVYEFFPEAIAIDAARFWAPARLADALTARDFAVDIDIDSGPEEKPAREALADARRRVVSQLAVLDDDAYARGLERLRQVAAAPDAKVTTARSTLCLTARRTR
jgi:ubiquinone/menaquinone biosynthesis C-methylase UbiE